MIFLLELIIMTFWILFFKGLGSYILSHYNYTPIYSIKITSMEKVVKVIKQDKTGRSMSILDAKMILEQFRYVFQVFGLLPYGNMRKSIFHILSWVH